MTPEDFLYTERDGDVASVVLNRGDKLNAMTLAMWQALAAAFAGFDADPSLRCVVIRSAAPGVFGAGADIAEFDEHRSTPALAMRYAQASNGALRAIRHSQHPTLAAIDGTCVGGGLEIASMCDLRICSDASRFGLPVARLGLTMNHCELQGLIDLVGRSTAMEILFEARIFPAAEALQKRLVNRVVPAADFAGEVARTVQRIAQGAPLVARWHKRFADQLLAGQAPNEQQQAEAYACFATEDFRTGFTAFLSKARPQFTGR